MDDNQPEYFQGLKFNLANMLWVNPQPDASTTIKTAERKAWLRDLRRYKRGLKSRVKVGALQEYIDKANEERSSTNQYPHYWRRAFDVMGSAEVVTAIITSMKSEEYPPVILEAFVRSVPLGYGQGGAINTEQVLENVDRVFTEHSVALRREYGVFGKTLHVKS